MNHIFVEESQFEATISDDEVNASDADGEMVYRWLDLNKGADYTPAIGTGVPNNALALDQNSLSQSTMHDPGRPPPRIGPANANPAGMLIASPSSGISSGPTEGTWTTNESLDEPPPPIPDGSNVTQVASESSKVAAGDMPLILHVSRNCILLYLNSKCLVMNEICSSIYNYRLLSSLFFRFLW